METTQSRSSIVTEIKERFTGTEPYIAASDDPSKVEQNCRKLKFHQKDNACLRMTSLKQKKKQSSISVSEKGSAWLCKIAITEIVKHPVILTKDQHISKLILKQVHELAMVEESTGSPTPMQLPEKYFQVVSFADDSKGN